MSDDGFTRTIEALADLGAGNSGSDGLRTVARLTHRGTRLVDDAVGAGLFTEPAFVRRLASRTAQCLLDAARLSEADDPVPPAWQPVANQRQGTQLDAVQFALAGVNAQLNHDAPQALVATCSELKTSPYRPDVEHDFNKFCDLLSQPVVPLREQFLDRQIAANGRPLTALADLITHFSINRARTAAWVNGLTLWQVASVDPLARTFWETLAEMTGLIGRQLLVSFADPLAATQPLSEEMLAEPLRVAVESDRTRHRAG